MFTEKTAHMSRKKQVKGGRIEQHVITGFGELAAVD